MTNNLSTQWLGFTESSPVTGGATPVRQYVLVYLGLLEQPPSPSRVRNLTQGQILPNTTPALKAAPIVLTTTEENDGMDPMYDYEITTAPSPNAGEVVSSGEMEDENACYVGETGCSDSPPTWQVPAGSLQNGTTYYAWVLTDWVANAYLADGLGIPQVQPPTSWGIKFSINQGLNGSGPSPSDSVGSVPGQSSTPATGAPSPGLPQSQFTVNEINGNLAFSVATPSLSTVGGNLALTLNYNSAGVTAGNTLAGLEGYYYNVVNGSPVLVSEQSTPTIDFQEPAGSGLVQAQSEELSP